MSDLFTDLTLGIVFVALITACLISGYYYLIVAQKPHVHAGSITLRRFLEVHVPALQEKFYPSPLLWGGQLQTAFAQFQRITVPTDMPYTREMFRLSDGGEVALDYLMLDSYNNDNSRAKPLLVLLLPGLASTSQSSYIRTLVQSVRKAGASIVVQNHRGCAGVPYKVFKSPRTHSGMYIGDLEQVAPHIRKKFRGYRIIGLGASLGGILLSKYTIIHPMEAKEIFECIIITSLMWDGRRGTESIEKPFINKHVINRAIALKLASKWRRFSRIYKSPPFSCNVEGGLRARTLREFDIAVSAPQYGFDTVWDYYDAVSSVGQTHRYSIPVFALHADDDPTQPGESIPINEAKEKSSKLALIVTARGGHLGWLEGIRRKSEHYVERVVRELVQAIRLHGNTELCGM